FRHDLSLSFRETQTEKSFSLSLWEKVGERACASSFAPSPNPSQREGKKPRLKSMLLLQTRFKSTAGLIESGLHGHHAELAVFNFAMCRHHPHKVNRMAGHRYVRMKAFGHDHRVTVAHDPDEFRLVRIRVDELHTE